MNYTANLTEERDELNANLEEAKKALQREMATRIALESKGHMPHGRKVRACPASFHAKLQASMSSFDAGFYSYFIFLVSTTGPKLGTAMYGC